MITMNELVDLRMQQHIAHEIYRQQIMQRIPDPFPPMLPIPMPRHVIMPPRVNALPGVEMTLQNDELWKQFHQIGTEMIITKSGRRMFPSMRLSVAGLEEDTNYCVLLEMVPIGDCRYKFSGSQWVPAGGAEPQSPQRMYLHPDSPAMGSHWQAQPILFNKVKLTNNTLDNSGHIVLASMHKYQPRLHVIRTADLAQIPWAPQQAFVFGETEFVAVTAYQNDRITKLKIDNNPFAKGFRETGQSRCKRKMSSSPTDEDAQDQDQAQQQTTGQQTAADMSPTKLASDAGHSSSSLAVSSSSICADSDQDGPQIKRMRSNGSACSLSSSLELDAGETLLPLPLPLPAGASICMPPGLAAGPPAPPPVASAAFMQHFQQNMQTLLRPSLVDLACTYFGRAPPPVQPTSAQDSQPGLYSAAASLVSAASAAPISTSTATHLYGPTTILQATTALPITTATTTTAAATTTTLPALSLPHSISGETQLQQSDTESTNDELDVGSETTMQHPQQQQQQQQHQNQQPTQSEQQAPPLKRKGFSISAILGGGS